VLHFAGHAVANETFPERSFLLLASSPARTDGRVTSADISRWPLQNLRLAVLSGCRTASGQSYRGEGIVGLVRPFMRAGVPSVVGASWDVDDYATRMLLSAFHETYARTLDAPSALRAAQLALKSSDDARLRDPGAWGGFVAISGYSGK
jgi:CHAT domain-containing protein